MALIPTLYAERLEGKIRYRLEVPERDVVAPLQQEFVQPIDPGTLVALQESADAILRSPEHPRFVEDVRQRGSVLYRTLVPAGLRAELARREGPLLVATSLYGVPWELFFDGTEFWGLRYALGRRILMDRPVPAAPTHTVPPRPRALVIGANPRKDLPFVREEIERIGEALGRVADVALIGGPLATFDAVTGQLGQHFDLIHFCGHVTTDPSGAPALLLADDRFVSAALIEANLAGHPIVVVNGCASVRGGSAPGAGGWEERFSSVAYGFLFGGAMAVVGTLCEVSDRRAAALADEFYRQVLGGVTVGEALRVARGALRSAYPGSPAWLSFVLYGNPAQRLAATAEQPARPVERPTASPRVEAATPRVVRRERTWWAVAVALALGAAASGGVGYWVHLQRAVVAPRNAPLVLGVMAIRARDREVEPWMRELTRDALNTMLSKVGGLQVYSRQKIDFLREKRDLSEIEAAEKLGMSKMLSATIAVANGSVVLDLEIVDIATGLLVATEHVQGPKDKLIDLQNQVADRALHDLGVQLTTVERQNVFADRSNDMLDNYRLLTETYGGVAPVPAGEPAPQKQGTTSWFDWPAPAYAAEADPEEPAIRAVLDAFRSALEAKSIDDLKSLQIDMPVAQERAYSVYFGNSQNLHVGFTNVDITIEGEDALATFTRRDTFTDAKTGREIRLEVRFASSLAKRDGRWRIKSLQTPS